jgi:hypothetical protein
MTENDSGQSQVVKHGANCHCGNCSLKGRNKDTSIDSIAAARP